MGSPAFLELLLVAAKLMQLTKVSQHTPRSEDLPGDPHKLNASIPETWEKETEIGFRTMFPYSPWISLNLEGIIL